MVGQTIGKYRVLDRVGRGGMGTVYRALDETLHREVAIKVLNADLNDPDVARRFRAEATTVARLSHPGIATIYELFQHDDQWLMVMEFVRGETLDRLLERSGALAAEHAAELCMQALAALAHAHSVGVVHRDLKPANIMVTESGSLKIMDFGIARVVGSEHLTNVGFMMGTPAYMAPEQVTGHEIDARADIYAMGVVFYRLTTGKHPFKGDTPFALAHSQVHDPPTPIGLVRTDLPPWVEHVIHRSLAKKPEDRFQAAMDFYDSLAGCLNGQTAANPYSSSAATGVLMTTPPPRRRVPTGTLPRPGASGRVPVSASFDAASQPTITAQTPMGSPTFGSGRLAAGPANTSGAVGSPEPVAASVEHERPGRRAPAAFVAAAIAIVGVGVAGYAMWPRRETPPPESAVAVSAPPPPLPGPAVAPAPQAGAPAPSAVSAAPSTPAATSTARSASAAPDATPASTSGNRAAPAPPPTTSRAAGASATGRGAPTDQTHEVFTSVKLAVVSGQKTTDRDILLNFAGGQLSAIPKAGGSAIFTLPYGSIKHATYVHGRDPRWNSTLPGPPEKLDVGGMLRTSKHWVVLQATDYFILKLEDSNITRAIQTIESRTGLTVDRPRDNK